MATSRRSMMPGALLTDFYQFTMAYALWRAGRACARACFEASFRRAPFGGGGALSAGLADCVAFVQGFRIDAEDIDFLRAHLPDYVSDEFYAFLSGLDASDVVLHALQEGTVAFPQVWPPPAGSSAPPATHPRRTRLATYGAKEVRLACTRVRARARVGLTGSPAARGRPPVFAATPGDSAAQLHQLRQPGGHKRGTLPPGRRQPRGAHGAGPQEGPGPEWGPLRLALRLPGSTLVDARRGRSSWCPRAQGFDATSNVLAAQVHGVPLAGTQAHSYITAFSGLHDLTTRELAVPDGGPTVDLLALSLEWRPRVCSLLGRAERDARDGELAAFVSYAQAFPRRLLLLVDTYSVHGSGTVNFCAVALALATLGLRAVGVRLDSGDLARQSLEVRAAFRCCAQSFELPWFSELKIVASNDVNEEKILAYNKQGHAIDCFGVGTALVTCERQPSLGCIYKLVELDGVPRCKLTEDEEKTTLPGRKAPYRLYGDDGRAVLDVLLGVEELAPRAGQLLPCRLLRPLGEQSLVRPSRVAPLHTTFWDRGRVCSPLLPLKELRAMSAASLGELGAEHKDLEAPTPYPVAVSEKIWALLEEMRRP
ncbi:nicotinate phosphoribosyltransferase isoform X2 [Petromyzon marinus]|uniref:nicotinate phosphoribosyltransferase isoform X2 n=1 Tax=Petromyzon marinus TaxID=7757 RepID=UPI003F7168AE